MWGTAVVAAGASEGVAVAVAVSTAAADAVAGTAADATDPAASGLVSSFFPSPHAPMHVARSAGRRRRTVDLSARMGSAT